MRTWFRFVVWFDKLGKIGAFSDFIPHFGISLNRVEQVSLLLKKIYEIWVRLPSNVAYKEGLELSHKSYCHSWYLIIELLSNYDMIW